MALPSWKSPRLFLASENPKQRWRHSSLYPAFRWRARAYRAAVRLQATIGLCATIPNLRSGWALKELLEDASIRADSAVVLIGTSGPAQKLTVQLWNGSSIVGYLKYGESPTARTRLLLERKVLDGLPQCVGPKVLAFGNLDNGVALLTAPVAGQSLPPKPLPNSQTLTYLNGLDRGIRHSIEEHPYIRALRRRAGAVVDSWLEPLTNTTWPVVFQHGDFAPWNVFGTNHQTTSAIDWEYGNLAGFPHLDAAYWVLQVGALVKRWSPGRTSDCAVQLLRKTIDVRQAESIVKLAAYNAYDQALMDGIGEDVPLQEWRRTVWEVI